MGIFKGSSFTVFFSSGKGTALKSDFSDAGVPFSLDDEGGDLVEALGTLFCAS